MRQMNLDSTKFEAFLRCLSLMKDICNDVDIRGGKIRQRSNDHSVIFEMDLNPLLSDMNIPITKLKEKLELFKCFIGNDVDVTDDERYSVADQISIISFKRPQLNLIDNQYIPDEEFNSLFALDENDVILSYTIPTMISDRMRTITQGFNVNNVIVVFEGERASITSKTISKDQYAKFVGDIVVEDEKNCSSNLIVTPFIIDHDGDMSFAMYEVRDGHSINKFATSIGDVPINIYGRSSLIEVENEDEEEGA
jgi:hypothetical protein